MIFSCDRGSAILFTICLCICFRYSHANNFRNKEFLHIPKNHFDQSRHYNIPMVTRLPLPHNFPSNFSPRNNPGNSHFPRGTRITLVSRKPTRAGSMPNMNFDTLSQKSIVDNYFHRKCTNNLLSPSFPSPVFAIYSIDWLAKRPTIVDRATGDRTFTTIRLSLSVSVCCITITNLAD